MATSSEAAPPPSAEAEASARLKDYDLARAKGTMPEQVAARHRTAATFVQIHFSGDSPDDRALLLSKIDYDMPLCIINAADQSDPAAPQKGAGFLGMGRRPVLLLSKGYAPQKPGDPFYALKYFPRKGT